MKPFRQPTTLAVLVLLTCWAAFTLGRKNREDQKQSPLSSQVTTTSLRQISPPPQNPTSDRTRTRKFQEQFATLKTPANFRKAIADLQFQADKTEENRLLSLLFQQWLKVSPIDALAEVRRIENLRHDILRATRIFEKWAFENPSIAQALLQQILDGRQSDPSAEPAFLDGIDPPEYLLSLISGLAQADPASTAQLLGQVTESPVRFHALDVLIQNWFPQNPQAVFDWAASLEEKTLRAQVLSKTAAKAGQTANPQTGIAWAKSLPSPADQTLALNSLTSQWAARHSRQALQWLSSQSPQLQFQLAPGIISPLTKVDPGRAADWLNQFEPAPEIDSTIAAYAKALASINPPAAIDSAQSITAEFQRTKITLSIAKQWSQSEPEKFQSFLSKRNNLPPPIYQLIE